MLVVYRLERSYMMSASGKDLFVRIIKYLGISNEMMSLTVVGMEGYFVECWRWFEFGERGEDLGWSRIHVG